MNKDPLFATHIRILVKKYYKPSYIVTNPEMYRLTLLDERAMLRDNTVDLDKDGNDTYTPYFIPLIIERSHEFAHALNVCITKTLKLEIRDDKTFQEAFREVEQYYRYRGQVKGSILTKLSGYCTDTIEMKKYPAQSIAEQHREILQQIQLAKSLEDAKDLAKKGLKW